MAAPRLVGVARAKELLILGRQINGLDAAAWGMIYRAVPEDDLDAEADALVDEFGAPTVAIGLTKRCLHLPSTVLVDAMENEALALELSSRTDDFREGLTAFTERRDARFEGR